MTDTPQTDQPSTQCGVEVPIYGVEYGDVYEPCVLPLGHDGGHDPSVKRTQQPDDEVEEREWNES